ncbi:3-dehydroquinate synthase [Oceanobacillus halophilus]|uniref:3-dehydroquinate synthase n=1 Tax=Oceanobacillus halophilus TaxID=930130 RepID=A0A495ACI7_9BACI|nr:3-dehydroquinate synthase [Oceanobacillus halophilus]RKQ37658.1 3-dehydroquinate synthase [Oceanobacillus halophilus]
MEKVQVQSSTNNYQIIIGNGLMKDISHYLTKEYSSILIITDDKVADLYLQKIKLGLPKDRVFEAIVPAGEQSKSIDIFYRLHTDAIKFGLDRHSLIIALGGGVVGDLAGFVASTFMRGIDFVQVPTTILAHDSSVGGKVAINHELGKNMIGNFFAPVSVIYDVETLSSLSKKEVRSGYAEIMKESMISDDRMFNEIRDTRLDRITNHQLQKHLSYGIEVKAAIVQEDEKESGVRKYLNLGHTLGHALEAEMGYGKLTHGEAVAIGLLFSLHVSNEIYGANLPFQSLFTWLKENDYPIDITNWDYDAVINRMKSDKKTTNKQIQMVLLKEIGKPTVEKINDDALKTYLQSFKGKLVSK